MLYFEVAPSIIVRSDSTVLTYSCDTILLPGAIVLIEIGKKQITGIVQRQVEQPAYATKPILKIIEETPLPTPLLQLLQWMSSYYATHLAVVIQASLPRGISKKRRIKDAPSRQKNDSRTHFLLNKNQSIALKKITSTEPGTILLHGITGSGKTAVYIEAARQTIHNGKSVLILLPEIALTTQIVNQFSDHFDNVILTHSKQTEATRHAKWRTALTSKEPLVVIGPRSALFMPLANIGLIVIDEAHEPSFKQEQSPRYSAQRAASILTKAHNAKLVIGSATPSISDYYIATVSNKPIVTMNTTAKPSIPPYVTIVDMTKRDNFRHHRFLSDTLLENIKKTLSERKQILIFHNRRGSASMTLCEKCGWQAICSNCFIPLSLHGDTHNLQCHICGKKESVPTSCPNCRQPDIIHKGIGTKLIESELSKLFPNTSICRFDGDSESDETVDVLYDKLHNGTIQIIIGTQVVAKGLDLPNLRTVGVIQADSGLSLPDFSSTERTFQLLAQVVGRVGRDNHETAVVVQSYQPSHFSVVNGLSQNYLQFYEQAIAERKRAVLPPFTFLLKLTCTYKTEAAAVRNASNLASTLRKVLPSDVIILGPAPAFYERTRQTFRWQIVIKSKNRATLVKSLTYVPAKYWQFELDPISLL